MLEGPPEFKVDLSKRPGIHSRKAQIGQAVQELHRRGITPSRRELAARYDALAEVATVADFLSTFLVRTFTDNRSS